MRQKYALKSRSYWVCSAHQPRFPDSSESSVQKTLPFPMKDQNKAGNHLRYDRLATSLLGIFAALIAGYHQDAAALPRRGDTCPGFRPSHDG